MSTVPIHYHSLRQGPPNRTLLQKSRPRILGTNQTMTLSEQNWRRLGFARKWQGRSRMMTDLDSLEAQMNDYAHVPDRWRTGGADAGRSRVDYDVGADEFLKMDPRHMDDEEYAEWIRAGMYRYKDTCQEYAENNRRKHRAMLGEPKRRLRKPETTRLAKLAQEERKRKKLEKEIRRADYAREEYHLRWKILLAAPSDSENALTFNDIPWPIASAIAKNLTRAPRKLPPPPVSLDDLTVDAIAAFLVPPSLSANAETEKKHRKDKLRETFLRFHPDKFEGR
ncbi:hypothetical protein B0H14DRAFT_3474001 [Mycena olivaceomarginata]|nr:hypothetical protein B0H14DRAFT_3474001 [Mycena olivaceomarginata]